MARVTTLTEASLPPLWPSCRHGPLVGAAGVRILSFQVKTIPLTCGEVALVDDDDFERLSKWKWTLTIGKGRIAYAYRHIHKNGKITNVRMHRLIIGAKANQIVDHIDGNGLNNQRSNLRLCTHAENSRNQRKRRDNNSGFKGVSWCDNANKYRAKIRLNYRQIHLGYFTTALDAAVAYNAGALKFHGQFAKLNLCLT